MTGKITPRHNDNAHGDANVVECTERSKPWVLAATILGSSMAFIDSSVVNVALPAIQSSLSANVSDTQWIVTAYMLTLSALILVGGAAGDRFGRRRIFVLGVIIFTATSVACGLAPNALLLIVARALQGIGGALLVPSSLAIISSTFPPKERGRAIGTWAGASALTSALGPVLGGWLVDIWSWRAIFFVNLPIAIVTVIFTMRHVPVGHNEAKQTDIDWRGGLLATAGLGALAYGCTAASTDGWLHSTVLISLLAGLTILALFIWNEARVPAPMMPLALFRSRAFSGTNAITLLLYFALGGALFFVPFNLIRIHGYSATAAGAAFLPFSLLMGGLSRWSGGLIDRYGARLPLIVGPLIVAAGFVLLAVPGAGGAYWTTFFPPMIVLGIGMTISVAPLTTTVMRATGDRYAGVASGINNATARVAGMLAVALLSAVAVGVFSHSLDDRLKQMHASPETQHIMQSQKTRLAEAEVPAEITDARERESLKTSLRDSFIASFRFTMLLAAVLTALSAVCAAFTIDRKR